MFFMRFSWSVFHRFSAFLMQFRADKVMLDLQFHTTFGESFFWLHATAPILVILMIRFSQISWFWRKFDVLFVQFLFFPWNDENLFSLEMPLFDVLWRPRKRVLPLLFKPYSKYPSMHLPQVPLQSSVLPSKKGEKGEIPCSDRFWLGFWKVPPCFTSPARGVLTMQCAMWWTKWPFLPYSDHTLF